MNMVAASTVLASPKSSSPTFTIVPIQVVDELSRLQCENKRLAESLDVVRNVDDQEIDQLWQKIVTLEELVARSKLGTPPGNNRTAVGENCGNCTKLQTQLAALDKQNKNLVSVVKILESEKQTLEARAEGSATEQSWEELREAKTRIAENDKTISMLQEDVKALARENSRLVERYNSLAENNSEESKRVKLDKRRYEDTLKHFQDKVCTLEEEKNRIFEECESLKRQKVNVDEELKNMKRQVMAFDENLKRLQAKDRQNSRELPPAGPSSGGVMVPKNPHRVSSPMLLPPPLQPGMLGLPRWNGPLGDLNPYLNPMSMAGPPWGPGLHLPGLPNGW